MIRIIKIRLVCMNVRSLLIIKWNIFTIYLNEFYKGYFLKFFCHLHKMKNIKMKLSCSKKTRIFKTEI